MGSSVWYWPIVLGLWFGGEEDIFPEALEDVFEDRNYLFLLILMSHNLDDVFED